jgi:DNA-binding beta-propeller fold protein YncE
VIGCRGGAGPSPRWSGWVIATTDIGEYPIGLAVNPRTDTIYVLNAYNDFVDRWR